MKSNPNSLVSCIPTSPKFGAKTRSRSFGLNIIFILFLFLASLAAHAQVTEQWDADGTTNGPTDGSGIWEGSTNWLVGGAATAWSDQGNAVIGGGVPGNYFIDLTITHLANSVRFTTSGYTLGDQELALTTGANSVNSPSFSTSAGVVVTLTNQISAPNGYFVVGSNSTANFGPQILSGGGNPEFGGVGLTSVLNLTNGFVEGGTLDLFASTINLYGGNFAGSRVDLGRQRNGNIPCTVNQFAGNFYSTGSFQLSRGNTAQCTLNIYSGITASTGNTFTLSPDSGDNTTLNMYGGVLNAGTGVAGVPGTTGSLNVLGLLSAASAGTESATFNLSGGVVTAKELLFGGGGTFSSNCACAFNMSGGSLFLDSGGIQLAGGAVSLTPAISLGGGAIAATANWSSVLAMSLTNGTMTFQTGDTNDGAFNISLSGALTGPGSLVKTGPGVLTLSGADTYAGSTTVKRGTLTIFCDNGVNTSVGVVTNRASSTLSTVFGGPGVSWACTSLNFDTNSTADFNFSAFLPSQSQAPIVVSGALQMQSTCTVTIEADNLYVGTYPLIQYGTFSGGLPATLSLPSGVTAHLANSGTAIQLVVTVSPNTAPAVGWNVGNGIWDNSTGNWLNLVSGAGSALYADGDIVDFVDDGHANPVVLTLNSTVQPLSIRAVNLTNNFLVTGSGAIVGSSLGVIVQGGADLAFATTNTYGGGTTVASGSLGINYGGDGLHNSAIGTGPLILTNGGSLDNSSGSNVTLITPIAEQWGNFGFVGTTNLTLGSTNNPNGGGSVTLSQNVVATINSNRLAVNSPIGDGGLAYSLTKRGNGALALNGSNTYTGGTILDVGELDINFGGDGNGDSAIGTGPFAINGGTIDNTSGALVTLSTSPVMIWAGSCTFRCTTNLDLGSGGITVPPAGFTMTVSSNYLFTEGGLSAGNGTGMTKAGAGTWVCSGSLGACVVVINAGTMMLNGGLGVNTIGSGVAVTINTGGSLVVTNATGSQIISGGGVTLSGGTFDINGDTGEKPGLTFNSGTIRDSGALATPPSTELLTSSGPIPLGSANCVLSVPNSGNTLDIPTAFTGTGSLTTSGAGTVTLGGTSTYTGTTTVGPGTLALHDGTGSAFITNSSAIILSTSTSALDLTSNIDANNNLETLTLYSNQTLSGFGTVTGLVVSLNDSTVSPGSASTIGTLTVKSNTTLAGTTVMKANGTSSLSDKLVVAGTLVLGGTLNLQPVFDSTFTVGQTFTLFSATGGISGGFTNVIGNPPGFPGFGLAWNTNNLLVNGTVSVVDAGSGSVPAAPTVTGVALLGGKLVISGTKGVPNAQFVVLGTTNLALPLTNWLAVVTNNFDGSGDFSVTNISTSGAARYFTIREQ